MRVLCCLDGTNLHALSGGVALLAQGEPFRTAFLYVIDVGPREELKFRHRPHPFGRPALREGEIPEAERAAAKEILDEAAEALPGAELMLKEGRPEREIVNAAAEWQADIILLCPRTHYGERHPLGPKSVGHVARFVVDHAPCPVLLLRSRTHEAFPIDR